MGTVSVQESKEHQCDSVEDNFQSQRHFRCVARISGRGVLKIFPLLRLPLMRVRVHEWVGSLKSAALAHAKYCGTNDLVGRGGALRSRCLLTTAIHVILRPVQRGVLEPPEPPPGYATALLLTHTYCKSPLEPICCTCGAHAQ